MTISKLTNNIQSMDEVDKINEIIDEFDNLNVDVDGSTITKNSSDELQTVAVKDNRSGNALKLWTGTVSQAPSTTDASTLYIKTDDTDVTLGLLNLVYPVGSLYIASGSMQTCPLQSLGVGTWQLKASSTLVTNVSSTTTAPVKGTGKTLGLTNGAYNYGLVNGPAGYTQIGNTSAYGANAGSTPSGDYTGLNQSLGITTDGSKSGIVADTSSLLTTTTLSVTIWERVS